MICADFLAGAHVDRGNPDVLPQSVARVFKFLNGSQRKVFLEQVAKEAL
jgi:hypothetical protein